MITLSPETEALANRLAEAQHLSVDDTVRQALEEKARAAGIAAEHLQTSGPSVDPRRAFKTADTPDEIRAIALKALEQPYDP